MKDRPSIAPVRWEISRIRAVLLKYFGPLLVVLVASLIRLVAEPYLGTTGFAISLVAMLIAAWIGGIGPCLMAQTLLLVINANWFEQEKPKHTTVPAVIISLSAYYFVGLLVAVLSNLRRSLLGKAQLQQLEMQSQREQLLAMLRCMGDGVIVCDQFARITLLNPIAEHLTGWSKAEALGEMLHNVLVLRHEDSRQQIDDLVRHALREKLLVATEKPVLLTSKSGTVLPVSYSAAPLQDASHQVSGVVVVFRDETERIKIERALRESDQRKDEFLATLAHELRNPLAPICMGVELLKDASEKPASVEEVREMLARQSRHMVRLIDDLLDVSRITRGSLELRRSLTKLEEIVRNAIEETRHLYENASHQLRVTLPEKPLLFYADPNRLTQVISNLLNNAAKFTPPGGRVELLAEVINDNLVLTVSDNGLGLPGNKLDSIFQMFTQVKHSLESGQSGLGIGLTLVRRLVEMHGGTISVHSEGFNQGCRFQFHLPLVYTAPAAEPGAISVLSQSIASKHRRVLVVDDNQDGLKALSTLIRVLGNTVSTAEDGVQAVTVAECFQPDIIFMDLGMPQMNGFEAAKRIRQAPWGKSMVLVATTGWGQAEDKRRTKEVGFDRHLVKPIDIQEVEQLLNDSDLYADRSALLLQTFAPEMSDTVPATPPYPEKNAFHTKQARLPR